MEIKEAMEILEKDIHTEVPKAAISARKHDAAVQLAIIMLNKQIPVRPIEFFTGNEYECKCPKCGGLLDTPNDVVVECIQYCGWCGQKLDWSEEDETI